MRFSFDFCAPTDFPYSRIVVSFPDFLSLIVSIRAAQNLCCFLLRNFVLYSSFAHGMF